MSMEFDMMYTRSKQPRYCSRIIDTRRTVFPEADGAQRMPFEGVLQTTGSRGCLTSKLWLGNSFTFPIKAFTQDRFEAFVEAHHRLPTGRFSSHSSRGIA